VFTRPDDLTAGQIRAEIAASWNFAAETLSYLPVGFGSHHWRAATGTAIDSGALALFRMWYDLSEIAGYIELFRPHMTTPRTPRSRGRTWSTSCGQPNAGRGCGCPLRNGMQHLPGLEPGWITSNFLLPSAVISTPGLRGWMSLG
jgi:hypothetical protein